jgi:hypothetical protein
MLVEIRGFRRYSMAANDPRGILSTQVEDLTRRLITDDINTIRDGIWIKPHYLPYQVEIVAISTLVDIA